MENFLDVYGARQAKLDLRRTELQEDLANVQNEMNERREAFGVGEESVQRRGVRITVVVLAEAAGEAGAFP